MGAAVARRTTRGTPLANCAMPDPSTPPDTTTLRLGHRALLIGAAVVINTAIYLVINHNPVRIPRTLVQGVVDHWLGLRAWTIWPYWALLLLAPAFALAIRRTALLRATLSAYIVAFALNCAIWLAWPTRLPRTARFTDLDPLTDAAWSLLLALDADTNCFPSGHVTLPVVICAGFCVQHPRLASAAILAVAALVPSIVTTGQHYAIDALAGLMTAIVGLWVTRHPALRGAGEGPRAGSSTPPA